MRHLADGLQYKLMLSAQEPVDQVAQHRGAARTKNQRSRSNSTTRTHVL
jgi:hypothetical protein